MARGPVLAITITGDNKDAKRAAKDTETAFKGLGTKVSASTIAVGTAIGHMAANALPKVIDFGKELFSLGSNVEIIGAKADTVFGASAGDIKSWADRVNESMGLSDEAVVGMASSLGDLLVPMGFAREEAAKMSKDTVELSGALAAWSQGKFDSAQVSEILTKAMLGERDGLKALGISISEADVQARLAAKGQSELTGEALAQAKALATQELIMEKSADAQAAWNDGTMDNVKSLNEMKAGIADAKVWLAQRLVPAVQSVVRWITTELVPAIREIIAEFKERWPEIRATVEPIIVWFRETVGSVIEIVAALWKKYGDEIMGFVEEVWPPIQKLIEGVMLVIKGVIDTVLGLITGDWDKAWSGIKAIFEGIWKAIVGIVEGTIADIKFKISVFVESLSGVVRAPLDAVRAVFSSVFDGIRWVVDHYIKLAKAIVKTEIDLIVGFVTMIPGRIAGFANVLFSTIRDAITGAKDWVAGRIDEIVGFATGLPGRMASLFVGMFDGIKEAFRSAINWVIDRWNGLEFRIPGFDPPGPGPTFGGITIGVPNIPHLAAGGVVRHRPGGIIARLGEGAFDEAVIPLKPGDTGRGGTTNIYMPAGYRPSEIQRGQERWERRNGPKVA
jgi:hypothetical protein